MNSSSAESVTGKLAAEAAKGKKAFLVLVNCEKKTVPRLGAPASVTVLNGRQAYEYLSKRPTFFDDLQSTLAHTFATYPTYASLLATV
jgi:hypothetical protein